MSLQSALDDFKRHRDDVDDTRFPGERRTTSGYFSGADGRLVHVDPDGRLRDFSYALSGRSGIDDSRFGLDLGDGPVWFDECERRSQGYHDDTVLVESTYSYGDVSVSRYDLTLGRAHLVHVSVAGEVPDDATLVTVQRYTPDGREGRVGRLAHADAVEVFHREERDAVAAATPVASLAERPPLRLDAVAGPDATGLPAGNDADERAENAGLGGTVAMAVELEPVGGDLSTTLASVVGDTTGDPPLAVARETAATHRDADAVRAAAREAPRPTVDSGVTRADAVRADLRVLGLLSAPSGARIAGPDFDPFYAHSGGYGYTWFRDDAEVSRYLLAADDQLGLDLDDWHDRSARFYCRTQRDDGTWPHRVWADSGALAPGWAHGRLEDGDGVDYQADQTASVLAYLATYCREREPPASDSVAETLAAGLDGLDATLADDGLPEPCQNAWENATGRFAHTAATFLAAYASLARAPVDDALADRARQRATAVHDALDDLWSERRGVYATRFADDTLDDRLDASTLALVDAHVEYAALTGGLAEQRRRRLASHVEVTLDGLYRDTGTVAGLVRFEGDDWRTRSQPDEKLWTVSTAWGACAAGKLATLLDAAGDDPAPFEREARRLLGLVLPGGPLCMDTGYLPEQVFDDGTADSATPLGWPHAMRTATVAHLSAHDIATPAARTGGD